MTLQQAARDPALQHLARSANDAPGDMAAQQAFDDRCEELLGQRVRNLLKRKLFMVMVEEEAKEVAR